MIAEYEFKGTQGKWYWDNPPFVKYDPTDVAPWVMSEINDSHSRSVLTGEDIQCKEADAHLIAAAPDLLKICIQLQAVLEPLTNNPVHDSVMNELKQAIHKALNIN